MTKSLVLIRHGQRDLDPDDRDNGLNRRGLEQARAVGEFYQVRFPDGVSGLNLLSSPRRRCRETLQPIEAAAGQAYAVDANLDEQQPGESAAAFDRRIQTFFDERAKTRARLTIACTHGDWLPRAIAGVLGHAPEFGNACWLELDWGGGGPELAWFIPTFEPFRTRS